MRGLYTGLGLGICSLGLLHILAATRIFESVTQAALWFVSGGILMVLTGVLNLLNLRYGRDAPGVKVTSIAANTTMTVFALMAGLAGDAAMIEVVGIVGLFAGATVVSLRPLARSSH